MLRIPPTLVVAFGIRIWFLLFRIVFGLGWHDSLWSPRFLLASDGIALAGYVLTLAGLLELASRLTGPDARAVRLSLVGVALGVMFLIGNVASNLDPSIWQHEWLRQLNNYGWFGASLLTVLPLAIALMNRHTALATTAIVFALALAPPVFHLVESAGVRVDLIDAVLRIGALGTQFALLLRFPVADVAPSRELAARGVRLTARAAVFRLVAAVLLVMLTMLFGAGTFGALRWSAMVAETTNLVCLVLFAWGLLRVSYSAWPELPRWPVIVAASALLWCAGVVGSQLPWFYRLFWASEVRWSDLAPSLIAEMYSMTIPITYTLAFGLVAAAFGTFAHRRGDAELASEARTKGAAIVLFLLASLAVAVWLVPHAGSHEASIALSLLAGILNLAATYQLAQLCGSAAETLESEPGVPTATVVSDSIGGGTT
ncbi:MAG TPA: hypothetical protein VLB44_10880 [Kofleriaceae bacterium]|nr:hypothetical protein [Kofleriaceae bacterium]